MGVNKCLKDKPINVLNLATDVPQNEKARKLSTEYE